MSCELVYSSQMLEWVATLDEKQKSRVVFITELLRERGVTLDQQYSKAIIGSRYALRELRVQSSGQPIRILYIFDPARKAILLIGGDKTGDDRWYRRNIPLAEKLYAAYLKGLK